MASKTSKADEAAEEGSSGEEDKYFRTSLFERLKSQICGGGLPRVVFLVGSKGIGKSTLLSQLHMAVKAMVGDEDMRTAYFVSPDCYDMPLTDYRKLKKRFLAKKPCTLFIDNMQRLPEDREAAPTLKLFLKETKTRSNWWVIVATSRHGLFLLVSGNKPLLSHDELQTVYCVNPEESVGKQLFKYRMGFPPEKELCNIDTDMLKHIGYVPEMVHLYATYRSQNGLAVQ